MRLVLFLALLLLFQFLFQEGEGKTVKKPKGCSCGGWWRCRCGRSLKVDEREASGIVQDFKRIEEMADDASED